MSDERTATRRRAAAIGVVLPPQATAQQAPDQDQHESAATTPGTAEGERMDAAPGWVRRCERCRGRLFLEEYPGLDAAYCCLNCGRRYPVTPLEPLPRLTHERRILNSGERQQYRTRRARHG